MRLVWFRTATDHEHRPGVMRDGAITEYSGSWADLLGCCAGPDPREVEPLGLSFPIEECTIVPPLPAGSRGLFCVGMNYWAHDAEARGLLRTAPSEHPVFFWKLAETMTSATADLPLDPAISTEFDWEIELGVVIGRVTKSVTAEAVADCLAGYLIVNDITARDLQRQHVQWFVGKNIRASSPLGPWITTLDEAGYPPRLGMELRVNGITKQRAETSDLIFDVPALVSTISRSVTLLPGDIIATGTPMGVGFARVPPEYLKPGDVIEAEIDGLGSQRNIVVSAEQVRGDVPSVAELAGAADGPG